MTSDGLRHGGFAKLRGAGPMILPSLLQCDFGDLRTEVQRLTRAGARVLHLDVMDGHFVPNLTYGMPIVAGLRRHTDLPLDVHMMVSDPAAYAGPMVDAGADCITFHVEAVADPVAVAGQIRDLGVAAGVAINPGTDFSQLNDELLGVVDLALVMSVEAGFGGQSFNPVALDRIRSIRERFPNLLIEIDGGINAETIGSARSAGCDLFVVGSAIFGQNDYAAAMTDLTTSMTAASGGNP